MNPLLKILSGVTRQAATVTWNPADKNAGVTLSNANRTMTVAGGSAVATRSTPMKSAGKWYGEVVVGIVAGNSPIIGVGDTIAPLGSPVGVDNNAYGYSSNGGLYENGAPITTYATFGAGDIIGFAFDFSTGKIWFSKNGAWQGGNPSGTGGLTFTATTIGLIASAAAGASCTIQAATTFTPPAGYTAL